RSFLQRNYIQSIQRSHNEEQLKKSAITWFEQIFPPYAWNKQDFSVIYRSGEVELSVTQTGTSNGEATARMEYTENLAVLYRQVQQEYGNRLQHADETRLQWEQNIRQSDIFWEFLREQVFASMLGSAFQASVFIPASRSFFANIQKNIFSLLRNDITIE